MYDNDRLAERFQENRSELRAVAYGMLGSIGEADDAVQEAWLRLTGEDSRGVHDPGGWLTTGVATVCLDMLRSRSSGPEDLTDPPGSEPTAGHEIGIDPRSEAALADTVALALFVTLETLAPNERLAFVLHDLFAVPFDEIAPLVQRSLAATMELTSRARHRVQGATVPDVDDDVQ